MRQITIEKITLGAQLIVTFTLLVLFGIAFYVAWMSDVTIPPDRLRIIDTMVGSLATMTSAAVLYWVARQRNASADAMQEPEEGEK